MDGNFDITKEADFVTVSWCVFKYTKRSYDHQNTNLIGGGDSSTQDEDNLNVTFVNNIWGEGCEARMPMARFGTIHLLNNYYNCAGCGSSVNPRINSEFLIENNYFEKGVKNIFSQSGAKAYVFKNNHYTESFSQPADKNSVNIPYAYTAFDVQEVPSIVAAVENGAGPTLTAPLTFGRPDALGAPVAAAYSYDGRFFRAEGAISLFDLNGKCLKTTENCLDMSAFPEGLYLVKSDAIVVKIKR